MFLDVDVYIYVLGWWLGGWLVLRGYGVGGWGKVRREVLRVGVWLVGWGVLARVEPAA